MCPLAHIFNLSLQTGAYPSEWKLSRVSPIPKGRDRSTVESYRPIAVLSAAAKVFERVLHSKITNQVAPFLADSQHGFRCNRSVNTNLLTVTDIISRNLDRGKQVDIVYFDFTKAFDKVDNDVLLLKLCSLGFSPTLLKLFKNYLSGRKQFVRYGGYVSDQYHTRSGVSQGSILGPLLFIIMINDLESVVKYSRCILYADDLKLVHTVESSANCSELQDDIDAVLEWSANNKLLFNISKCCTMSFTRSLHPFLAAYTMGADVIPRVSEVRDLGVLFDPQLSFNAHISELAVETYRRLGFVMRNARDFHDVGTIKVLYFALVRSKIEVSSIVWSPHEACYTLLLEKVQKAFLRFLYKRMFGCYPFMFPTKFLLGVLGLNSLETRRAHNTLLFMIRILRGETDCHELVSTSFRLYVPDKYLRARSHPLLAMQATRTAAHRFSPLNRASRILWALLDMAPHLDIFADKLSAISNACLAFCEKVNIL